MSDIGWSTRGSGRLRGIRLEEKHTYPRGDGFNAFGYPVSTARQAQALEVAVEEFGCQPWAADSCISEAAVHVAADEPQQALQALWGICDLTGAYRLLAVLCTPSPEEDQ